jgi:hypothetical protein
VSVFRGVDEVRECVEVADTGVADAGVMGTGAEGNMGGWYVDWLVNMLGHCGIINGCSCGCVVLGVGCGWCGGCMPVPYIGSMGMPCGT